MSAQQQLKLVEAEIRNATDEVRAIREICDHVIDIYTAERQRIMAKDWSAVHVAGDRAKPLPSWFRKRS